MRPFLTLPTACDKPLFTPGPLTTSLTVKQAMQRDLGSRDRAMIGLIAEIREALLAAGGVAKADGWESVLIPGSGTYAIEAVLTSAVPADARLLLCVNGAYGERMVRMAAVHGMSALAVRFGEDSAVDARVVDAMLDAEPTITHVAFVHSETTTGILNDLEAISAVAKARGKTVIVDAMSSFGGVPIDLRHVACDFLVSSANKCIEGVPGFAFAICRRDALLACEGKARTLSLDLYDQWRELERSGQFRFTPPTHALLAFHQALVELEGEGGIPARHDRYIANRETLFRGMEAMGFVSYLGAAVQGPIISTWRYPDHPAFDFGEFYAKLSELGYVIYPGKLAQAEVFRIGHIGRLFPRDMMALLAAIAEVMADLGIPLPLEYMGD
jgi:2-aminoethylphosphonate-pyruvate transaminase